MKKRCFFTTQVKVLESSLKSVGSLTLFYFIPQWGPQIQQCVLQNNVLNIPGGEMVLTWGVGAQGWGGFSHNTVLGQVA